MALDKPIDEITEEDLQELISNNVQEGKKIDYKLQLIGSTRDDKKELLADVSSFANASGGHLIFGINEEEGMAKELVGISNIDADAEKLRLDNIIRDGIKPRIFGISIRAIKINNGNFIFIIYIPNSWSKPHVVESNCNWRFYSRHSAGKYPLDIYEVKSLFLSSDTIVEKIKNFRHERISNIIAGETPIELDYEKESYLIFHLVPLNSFEINSKYDFIDLLNSNSIAPINSNGYRPIINFDGILSYFTSRSNLSKADTYLQLFRNGIIEAVDTSLLNYKNKDIYGIPSISFKKEINEMLSRGLIIYKKYQIPPPFFLIISLIGIKNYVIVTDPYDTRTLLNGFRRRPIDRDNLLLPEVLIDDYKIDINKSLKIVFDSLWNAAGWTEA